ncbi:MAG: tetratricopeptide repeat protein, partial [Armatimonadetes bacterium]|nr:tetratricopeptide repeat protein [Armatimonadota bacterium]
DLLRAEVQEAQALLEAGRWREARHRLRELAREHPGQPIVLAALGDCYGAAGRWREAVYWYERCIDQRYDPEVASRLHNARAHLTEAPARPPTPRLIAAVALSFIVLCGAVAALVFLSRPARVRHRPMPVGEPSPVLQPGEVAAPQRAAAEKPQPAPAQPLLPGAPAVIQPQQLRPPQSPAQPGPQPSPASQGPRPAPSFPVRITHRVEAPATDEDYFLTQVLEALSWPDGTPMSGEALVVSDPVAGHAFVTLSIPRSLTSNNLAQVTLETAFAACVALTKSSSWLNYVSVRTLYTMGGGAEKPRTVVAFRGDTSRQIIEEWQRAQRMPSLEEMWRQVFANPWWNPDVPTGMTPAGQ